MQACLILGKILTWMLPEKQDRRKLRKLLNNIKIRQIAKKCQINYKKVISKIVSKEVKRVLFLVNENSKWKAQSLYDAMKISTSFEPIICLTIADIQKEFPREQKIQILNENKDFFIHKNMKVVLAYDIEKNVAIDLKNFNPDIVFYQQPYNIPKNQQIRQVSNFALTCYIPYYLPDYKNFDLDCGYSFHKELFRFYILDENLKEAYKKYLSKDGFNVNNLKAVGHTMLDNLREQLKFKSDYKCVIYAPHWAICNAKNENNINISTFNYTGKQILDYAKRHPEIKWIFKPHPTLKTALKRIGEMSNEEIKNYYNDWESIAECCYDSQYIDLFNKSSVMITDSGSFLLEYFCTSKPLVHLISPFCENMPYPYLNDIFESFYIVNNFDELDSILDDLLLKDNDYLKEKREAAQENHQLLSQDTAQNIIDDLIKSIRS